MSEIEKAIQVYETEKECMNRTCSDCQGECLIKSPAIPYGEAREIALGALREKAEREKGCEYCTDPSPSRDCCFATDEGGIERILCKRSDQLFDFYIDERHIDYCPRCGRKLVP